MSFNTSPLFLRAPRATLKRCYSAIKSVNQYLFMDAVFFFFACQGKEPASKVNFMSVVSFKGSRVPKGQQPPFSIDWPFCHSIIKAPCSSIRSGLPERVVSQKDSEQKGSLLSLNNLIWLDLAHNLIMLIEKRKDLLKQLSNDCSALDFCHFFATLI